jgi:hypothetical protein
MNYYYTYIREGCNTENSFSGIQTLDDFSYYLIVGGKINKSFLGGSGGRFFKKAPLVAEGK